MTETSYTKSRCIISGLFSSKDKLIEKKLELITSDIERKGGLVLECLYQKRGVSRSRKSGGSKNMDAPMNSATFLGKGKVEELGLLAKDKNADTIVFYNELSLSQISNISICTGCRIVSYLRHNKAIM